MFFTPSIKPKKCGNNKCLVKPFPILESDKKYTGVYTGISVEVFDNEDIVALYDNGFFGKGSRSKSAPQAAIQNATSSNTLSEIVESLSLGLEEAFFLAYYLNVLEIKDSEGREFKCQDFFQECIKDNELFVETLVSYIYLKSKGWVVKSGLKFGGNYLIYHKGPRYNHASFVVLISTPSNTEHLDTKNFKGIQRIAETSDKDVLILEVHKPVDFEFSRIEAISNIEISESIIRRFNCTSYVQTTKI